MCYQQGKKMEIDDDDSSDESEQPQKKVKSLLDLVFVIF